MKKKSKGADTVEKDKVKVNISNKQKAEKIPTGIRMLIRRACIAVLKMEEFHDSAEVEVSFVDDKQIHEMNLESRGVDRPTDVLSFPMFDEDFDDGEMAILGDIVLSLEKAKSQAEEYGHSFEREVAFLTVHSVLHLLGYDHELSEEDEKDTFFRQEEILKII